jgi:hypothetical protein
MVRFRKISYLTFVALVLLAASSPVMVQAQAGRAETPPDSGPSGAMGSVACMLPGLQPAKQASAAAEGSGFVPFGDQ